MLVELDRIALRTTSVRAYDLGSVYNNVRVDNLGSMLGVGAVTFLAG